MFSCVLVKNLFDEDSVPGTVRESFELESRVLSVVTVVLASINGPTFSSSQLGREVLKLKQKIASSAHQCPSSSQDWL